MAHSFAHTLEELTSYPTINPNILIYFHTSQTVILVKSLYEISENSLKISGTKTKFLVVHSKISNTKFLCILSENSKSSVVYQKKLKSSVVYRKI